MMPGDQSPLNHKQGPQEFTETEALSTVSTSSYFISVYLL